jgi:D-sedoheptulose 7-phosphate isomerase
MTFPFHQYDSIAGFYRDYRQQLAAAAASVDDAALDRAGALLARTVAADGVVYSCGNGGSAAIANHLVCDHSRGVAADTGLRPRIHSLSCNVEILTAIANDVAYAEIFAHQLALAGRPGDLLITISSSGDSENVVRAIQHAKENGIASIAITGFAGGRSAALADVNLHVQGDNYGVIEDVHQSLMHVLAQYLRQARMDPTLVAARKF